METNPGRTSREALRSRTTQSREFLDCLAKWMIVFNRVYRQPMTDAAVWAYREALSDLSVEELERGCIGAMKQTRFTPTPAEIREYGISEAQTEPMPDYGPQVTQEEAKEFFAKMKAEIPCLSDESLRQQGVLVVTDEMRAEAQRKKLETLRRFGKSA